MTIVGGYMDACVLEAVNVGGVDTTMVDLEDVLDGGGANAMVYGEVETGEGVCMDVLPGVETNEVIELEDMKDEGQGHHGLVVQGSVTF